jgi:ribosomal protein S18 acetylase RimI-like enzyme
VHTPAVTIHEVDGDGADELASLVRKCYADVAIRFALTAGNCPTHPSLCKEEWIRADLAGGTRFFASRCDEDAVGCYGLVPTAHHACRVVKLGVRPEWRGKGIGTMLLDDARGRARRDGLDMVEVGVLYDNQDLVAWYRKRGFELSGTARYPHLPFTVGFLFADL